MTEKDIILAILKAEIIVQESKAEAERDLFRRSEVEPHFRTTGILIRKIAHIDKEAHVSNIKRAAMRKDKIKESFKKYFDHRQIGALHEYDILFQAYEAGAKWERQRPKTDHN